DRGVFEQQLQRPQAEGLVQHLFDQPLALLAVEHRVFAVAEVLDNEADFALEGIAFQLADAREIELIDQLAVDAALEFLELRFLLRLVGRPALGKGGATHLGDSFEANTLSECVEMRTGGPSAPPAPAEALWRPCN